MATSFRELRTYQSQAAIEAVIFGVLGIFGFQVTAWTTFSFPYLVVQAFAKVLADVYVLVAAVASGGYGDTAAAMREERWLDIWAWDRFRLTREPERFATGVVTLVDAGGGAHVIPAGGLIVGIDGVNYRSTASVTVPLNGTATVAVIADAAGSIYNLPTGSGPWELVTDFPGLTVTNPAQSGTETWLSTAGADRESNAALYERAVGRWAVLSVATPKGFYAAKIREAVPTITKVAIDAENPNGPGSCEAICATGAGPASGADIILAQSTLDAMRSVGASTATARAAVAVSVPLAGVAYVTAAKVATARAGVAAELSALQVALPLGGTVYAVELIRIVKSQDGVRDFVPSGGLVNTTTSVDQIATLRHEVTYIPE